MNFGSQITPKGYRRLFGVSRDDRMSPGAFKNRVLSVRVGAVETNNQQKSHAADSRYGVIRELMGFDSESCSDKLKLEP
jgi:hypothetical protein